MKFKNFLIVFSICIFSSQVFAESRFERLSKNLRSYIANFVSGLGSSDKQDEEKVKSNRVKSERDELEPRISDHNRPPEEHTSDDDVGDFDSSDEDEDHVPPCYYNSYNSDGYDDDDEADPAVPCPTEIYVLMDSFYISGELICVTNPYQKVPCPDPKPTRCGSLSLTEDIIEEVPCSTGRIYVLIVDDSSGEEKGCITETVKKVPCPDPKPTICGVVSRIGLEEEPDSFNVIKRVACNIKPSSSRSTRGLR